MKSRKITNKEKVTQLSIGSSCWQQQANEDKWIGLPGSKDGQMGQLLRTAIIQGSQLTMKRAVASLGQGLKSTVAEIGLSKNIDVKKQEPWEKSDIHQHAQRSSGQASHPVKR